MNPQRPLPGRTPPAPRRAVLLGVLAAAQFTVMLATSIVNVALPQIRAGAGLSDGDTTWVVNAYGLAFGALLLAGGRAADMLGRRRVLILGLALFAAASLGAGLASSAGTLIAARAVQGLGAAAIAPAALALAMELSPSGAERGRALAVWGAVSGAGGAGGVLLGGVLTQAWGWSWIFYCVAIGSVLVAAAVVVLVPAVPAVPTQTADREPAKFDLLGTAAVTLALTSLVWGLTTARSAGWTDGPVLYALAAAALLLALFVRIELRRPNALIPPRLFGTGRVAVGQPPDGAARIHLDRAVLLPAALPTASPRSQSAGHRLGPTPARRRQYARIRARPARPPAAGRHRDRHRGHAHRGRGSAVAVPDQRRRKLPGRHAGAERPGRPRPERGVRSAHRPRRGRRPAAGCRAWPAAW